MKNTFLSVIFITLIITVFIPGNTVVYGEAEAPAIQNKSGFIEIEPVDFYFHMHSDLTRLYLTSSVARLWYTFQPADQDCEDKPLLVFFNGGPGSATTDGLMSFYTGRWTLDNSGECGGQVYIPNPVSWTQLGNLLHVDARQAGFSYCIASGAEDTGIRYREFGAQNFNAYFDAADFIRVLFRFLRNNPGIEKNPVIIVGESYGGIRSTTMLYILLNYQKFGNGEEIYQDEELVKEIQAHYNRVFPQYADKIVPPEVIAGQFSRQILIQPAITRSYEDHVEGEMLEEDGSVMFQLAEEVGIDYIPCRLKPGQNCDPIDNAFDFLYFEASRDWYNISQPVGWLSGWFNNAAKLLGYKANLMKLTGADVAQIPGLYASARTDAYKVVNPSSNSSGSFPSLNDFKGVPLLQRLQLFSYAYERAKEKALGIPPAAGDLEQTFGVLKPWDRYFIGTNYYANYAHFFNAAVFKGYDVYYGNSTHFGTMFLKNLAYVKTFITHAKYDLVVYSAAFPSALAHHTDILSSVFHDTEIRPGVERPGWILVNYKPGAFPDIPGLQNRVIRFPLYTKSGHAVTVTEPVEMFDDVVEWLNETE